MGSSGSNNYSLTVERKFIQFKCASPHFITDNKFTALPSHSPTITVAARHSSDGCGKIMILNCTDNQVENLFSPPTKVWISPNDTVVPTDGESNPRMDTYTRQLIFSDITHTNGGPYTCRSIINIPQAQIISYFDKATITVDVNGKVNVLNRTDIDLTDR